ncbi:MAG: SGNH/GDSL hydrolase family protein [Planctomycetales bacterium]|nr:SGNH/GDSL hydrolase family protein [Planctomycetales bacterium]
MNGHIVLIGDSIFDNAVYVPGGPSVTGHVQRLLPDGWDVSLVAVDGATVATVFNQLGRIPSDATHLVLSVGGNDALWTAGNLFADSTNSVREALDKLGATCKEFATEYRRLVDELRTLQRELTLCTIYDSVPGLADSELAGLCVFNDAISRTAFAVNATLIDLRNVCDESSDYAGISPIEPSASGGGKIARAIMDAVLDGGVTRRVIA